MSLEGAVMCDDVINLIFLKRSHVKDFMHRNHVEIASHIGSRIFILFNFRFGQEVKVKLGSPFCKYFFTINNLYNDCEFTSWYDLF